MMIRNALLLLLSICIVLFGFGCNTESDINKELRTSLIEAKATPASVKQFLAEGANPNYSFVEGGLSPLMWALSPVRVNMADPDGAFPAQPSDDQVYAICEVLIQAGANVNYRAKENDTAVSEAAITCYPKTMQLLIDSGADIHIPSSGSITPLVQAVFNDCPECVIILLEAGADVHAGSLGGKSVLQLALQNRSFQNTQAFAMIEEAANAQTTEASLGDSP